MRTCLICEDHAIMREALVGLVHQAWPEARVIEAVDYPEAWDALAQAPEFCLCDLDMPGAGAVEGVARLRAEAPDMPILIITALEDDATLLALLRLGVSGFAQKSASARIIEAAIRLILAGGRYLPPRVAELASAGDGPAVASANLSRLTQRQVEVLRHISRGLSNKEIARLVDLSPATVKAHAGVAFAALGAVNRADAVLRARERGLI